MTRIPEQGAPIVIVPKSKTVLHLPAVSRHPNTGRPVQLAEYIAAKGTAPPWPSLCGKKGDVWIFGPVFAARSTCPECMQLAVEVAA